MRVSPDATTTHNFGLPIHESLLCGNLHEEEHDDFGAK